MFCNLSTDNCKKGGKSTFEGGDTEIRGSGVNIRLPAVSTSKFCHCELVFAGWTWGITFVFKMGWLYLVGAKTGWLCLTGFGWIGWVWSNWLDLVELVGLAGFGQIEWIWLEWLYLVGI